MKNLLLIAILLYSSIAFSQNSILSNITVNGDSITLGWSDIEALKKTSQDKTIVILHSKTRSFSLDQNFDDVISDNSCSNFILISTSSGQVALSQTAVSSIIPSGSSGGYISIKNSRKRYYFTDQYSVLTEAICGSGDGPSYLVDNILYVSPWGVTETSVKGNPDLSWPNPWEAIAAADSGDVLIIKPGRYLVTEDDDFSFNTYKSYVDQVFEDGAIIVNDSGERYWHNSGTEVGPSNIYGRMEYIGITGFRDFRVHNENVDVHIELKSITTNAVFALQLTRYKSLYFKCDRINISKTGGCEFANGNVWSAANPAKIFVDIGEYNVNDLNGFIPASFCGIYLDANYVEGSINVGNLIVNNTHDTGGAIQFRSFLGGSLTLNVSKLNMYPSNASPTLGKVIGLTSIGSGFSGTINVQEGQSNCGLISSAGVSGKVKVNYTGTVGGNSEYFLSSEGLTLSGTIYDNGLDSYGIILSETTGVISTDAGILKNLSYQLTNSTNQLFDNSTTKVPIKILGDVYTNKALVGDKVTQTYGTILTNIIE